MLVPFFVLVLASSAASASWAGAAPAPARAQDYAFKTETALLIFHVRPDHTQAFEAVIDRIAQGLDSAADPVRRQQKAGWRVLRSAETLADTVVYVVVADPVVAGADYDPVRMIAELLPGESQQLYERLKAAVVRVERMGLNRVR